MKRCLLLLVALGCMAVVTGLGLQGQDQKFALLDWANQAKVGPAPIAVLLEFGLKDDNIRDWSGRATIVGADIVHREGYRFRAEDKLDGTTWQATSHRGMRVPKAQPAVNKMEPIATVGVVFHLTKVTADARLTIELKADGTEKVQVALAEVLAGKSVPLWNGAGVVRLISTASGIATGKTEDDCPAAAYAPDGTLWVAYTSYTVREDERRIEAPSLKTQPVNFKQFYTPEFGEQLFVKSYNEGKWSDAIPVTGPEQDIGRCAIAANNKGEVWVTYSAQRNGNFDLFASQVGSGKAGGETRIAFTAGSELSPSMCTATDGTLYVACQAWNEKGQANITVLDYRGGAWSDARVTTQGAGNCWNPVLAAGPNGEVALAYDVYREGDYDVEVMLLAGGPAKTLPVAASARFEARPTAVYDAQGRLWIAYEEGPEKWGKDYGAQDSKDGNPLYNERSVRVACIDRDGTVKKPAAELPTSTFTPPQLPFEAVQTNRYERASRYAYPKIGLDGNGRVWLSYRRNFGSRYSSHPGAYWLTYVRRLETQGWSEPIEVHHSDGLLDHRPVLLPHVDGGLVVVHNTDGRYTTPLMINNDIFVSVVKLPSTSGTPTLAGHKVETAPASKDVLAEHEAVQRIKRHRIDAGGKNYQLLRGEYHRHTEISWDGAPDGSLEDMFRYAIDAVAFDWIGNGDHDNGAGREYPWHLTQKFTDAYLARGAFTPMFTYERSVSYPHGHRNVMFARRGIRTLPRLAAPEGKKAEGGVHPDDTKMLYRYLRELDGICAVHTSATGMGTDWRDNDPVVEPIVEIYQGDRMSYEMEGAPRAGYDPQTNMLPANVAGWFPKGFINLALQKGYKLGFQASSDHWSTHISFFIILAERNDRESLLAAVKKRHCYGATDNIIVDFRCGAAIMGDEVKTAMPPSFSLNAIGTANLAKVEILRDSEVVATLKTNEAEAKDTWTDRDPRPGTHYYYARILQSDNEIAWSSPIWVTTEK